MEAKKVNSTPSSMRQPASSPEQEAASQSDQQRTTPSYQAVRLPNHMSPQMIRHMQRTLGNRTVGQLLSRTPRQPARNSAPEQPAAGVDQTVARPIQRTIKIESDNKEYKKGQFYTFMTEYVIKLPKNINFKVIENLIDDDESHNFADIEALVLHAGVNEQEDDEEIQKEEPKLPSEILEICDSFGKNTPKIKDGDNLKLFPSGNRSSRPMYEANIDGKKYIIKQEFKGRSEFLGMKEMAKQGIETPSAVSLIMEDGNDYILMEYIENLFVGLRRVGLMDNDTVEKAAYDLGKVHVTDIKIGNVDRMPWRGNQHKGHLFNIFSDYESGKIIALDTEKHLKPSENMLKNINTEFEDIQKNPFQYAENMASELMKINQHKMELDKDQKIIFVKAFAKGMLEALPKE